jgi:Protein of unknwon function (DUF3310)
MSVDQLPMHDTVLKAKHYNSLGAACSNCGHPIECIDIIKHMDLCLGNVFKYLWRAVHKGEHVQDLWKSFYYMITKIEMVTDRPLPLLREAMAKEKDASKPIAVK